MKDGGERRVLLVSCGEEEINLASRFDACTYGVYGRVVSGGSMRLEIEGERVAPMAVAVLGGVFKLLIGEVGRGARVDERIGS